MSDGPANLDPRHTLAHRILTSARQRLEGRWDAPAAWRVLCEEAVAVWRSRPQVGWALIVPRSELGAVAQETEDCDRVVIWTADGRITWRDRPSSPQVWAALDAAPAGLLAGSGECPLASGPALAGWLSRGVPAGRGHGLALVLGLARSVADPVDADELAGELGDVSELLTAMLGQRRRLSELSAEATTVRSECEALSRLGELRARLAAVTAHELKTPLTSITAYAEVLEQQSGDPDFTHSAEFLRVIRSEADRLLRLVDRLLDSSRRGRGPALADPVPVEVGTLVDDVLRSLAPQASNRDLQLTGRISTDLPCIDGDGDLIRQVLVNLLGNALKFTPPGGRVVLGVREDASMVRLAVSDTGPGIAPHDLRSIFQSFYRTRTASQTDGVGLGLSIVKDIVALHGGHLDVHSRFGRGTTFSVLLPKEQQHLSGDTALTSDGFDPILQRRLGGHTLRLVAELAAARAVAVFLPAVDGGLVATAAMGLAPGAAGLLIPSGHPIENTLQGPPALASGSTMLPGELSALADEPGQAMLAPLNLGDGMPRGLILVARRLTGGAFGADDLGLMRVLADILGKAWSATLQPDADRRDLETVTEALAALTGLRRSGVPTADPLALRLLTRTGRRLGLSSYEIRLLQYAGALHDAGMVVLDPDVIQKPEQLDLDERDHIDRHPQRSLDLLGPLVQLPELQAVIRHHHERVDGRGYPEGRRGEAIPLGARILAVIDAFFAMIRSRPWREGLSVAAAVDEIQRHAGTQFDQRVVVSFLGVLLEEGLLSGSTETGAHGHWTPEVKT
jgi:signal transduction histidine kinase